ncbi:pentatricopeptide repeat-containing protein [Quercus suber]|uniref:Pentatricopeptide repeat-containing protein n=1 Tax=Quercus suber TaxID=58331 RepID=A0AAW0JIS7_QUESU
MKVHGFTPSVCACNALLDALLRKNEIKLAWCCYGAIIRCGVLLDRGDFGAAFATLNQMCERKIDPGFSTYSSILDGACKYENAEVIEKIMSIMVEKELLPKTPLSEYDLIVQKFSDLGKTFAAEMFYKRACAEKIGLRDATYGCMLRALSKEERVKEAISVYRLVSERGITVNDKSYQAFLNVLCMEDQLEEGCELLRDVIRKGCSTCSMELSKFVASQCSQGRWKEAEELVDVIFDKGLLLDSSCCCLLVRRYCSSRRIDSAIALHIKMERLNVSLDIATYNVLLNRLFRARRIEEAIRVFDQIRGKNLVSSESFTIVIRGLCRVKELRKAMKFHDEMLNMGLKPAQATYKRLISGFK